MQNIPNPYGARANTSVLIWSRLVWSRNETDPTKDRCVGAASMTIGAPIILQQCTWTPGSNLTQATRYYNQLWSLPTPGKDLRIGAGGSGSVPLCLDVIKGAVVLNKCSTSETQKWFVNRFSLVSPISSLGTCLDLAPGALRPGLLVPQEGTKVVLNKCKEANQTNSTQYFPETRESSLPPGKWFVPLPSVL